MTQREWGPNGISVKVLAVKQADDGEWWATLVDDHAELFVQIKLVEKPDVGAMWGFHLYDPARVEA